EAVLLAGDADGPDRAQVGALRERACALAHGAPPGFRMLLGRAGREAREQVVGARGARDDRARIDVDEQGLRALRTDVEAEEEVGSHLNWERRAPARLRVFAKEEEGNGRRKEPGWSPALPASPARRAGAPS